MTEGYGALKWRSTTALEHERISKEIFVKVLSTSGSARTGVVRKPSPVVCAFLLSAQAIRLVDLTIVLPTSLLRTQSAGGYVADSGLVLGMAGLGSMVSIPFLVAMARASWGGFKS